MRISGCRANNNGRNGISLTHGTGNIIENCRIDRNNRLEQVAGIDLEPDQGLNTSDNRLIGNITTRQNVGIQMYSYNRAEAIISNNAICNNTATGNSSAGIWDHNANGDIFVNNTTSGNGTNFSVDRSAKVGSAYTSSCQVPPLSSDATATPTPGASPTSTPTRTPSLKATPTPTPTPGTVSTRLHTLSSSGLVNGKGTITSTVDVQDPTGAASPGATVKVDFTNPDGSHKSVQGTTDATGRATIKYTVSQAGVYQARVIGISLSESVFVSGPQDVAAPVTVS